MKKILFVLAAVCLFAASSWAQCDYDHTTGVIKIYKHDGSLKGEFSVSSTKKVKFAQGNLQYTRENTSTPWSNGKFSFMENQWDVVETVANPYCTTDYGDKTAIGLFGWGTKTNPWNTSTNNSQYSSWYEWGENAISNGGNMANSGWRTLTKAEWNYILQDRSGNRFAKANVHGVNGLILLPDGWTQGASAMSGTLSGINNGTASYSAVSNANWTILEGEGCVFLPVAGRRIGTQVINTDEYWTSTDYNSSYASVLFGYRCPEYSSTYDFERNRGRAVRLVKDVPNP